MGVVKCRYVKCGKSIIILILDIFKDSLLPSDWCQVEVIDLVNDGTGLGFGIIGGQQTGVVVKTILPGGVADRSAYI